MTVLQEETSLSSRLLSSLFDFAAEAGNIALELQTTITTSRKADLSPVTEGDLAISKLAEQVFNSSLFIENGITYVDEEAFDKDPSLFSLQNLFSSSVITVDPIGGTTSYSSGLPFFGTYVGLLTQEKPWLGLVYLPSLKELFYTDGNSSFFVTQPFTSKAATTKILPPTRAVGDGVIFSHVKDNIISQPVMNPYCMGVTLTWPLLGRGDGVVFKAKLWDSVTQWAIAKQCGFEFIRLDDWSIIEKISLDDFTENLQQKVPWMMVQPSMLPQVKKRIQT